MKHYGEKCVIAVEITSSPKTLPDEINGNAENFYKSLCEICSWDWHGAKLVIEHCDSYTEQNMKPQKDHCSQLHMVILHQMLTLILM